jgi:TolA-binding protein
MKPRAISQNAAAMGPTMSFAAARLAVFAAAVLLVGLSTLSAQAPADKAAEQLLQSAHKAWADRNYAAASKLYRDFLGKYPGRPETQRVRLALGVCLLESNDLAASAETLEPLAYLKDAPGSAAAAYHLGLAQRGLALKETEPAKARSLLEQAARQFRLASASFAARAGDDMDSQLDHESSCLARAYLAEMQLRLGQAQEAQATAAAVIQDAKPATSLARRLALYHHGLSSFLLKEPLAAGRSLGLVPGGEPGIAPHARYLLARIHQQADERGEAVLQFENALALYEQERKDAIELLKKPESARLNPVERQWLTDLAKGPAPESIGRAGFHLGVLQLENGRFLEAQGRFAAFLKQHPKSPLADEALLGLGYCQVQAKQYGEAVKTLRPLLEREPYLADQALFLVAKAQSGAADANNPKAFQQTIASAIETLRQAADRAARSGSDNGSRRRRGEILLELADTYVRARQYGEAAAAYGQVLTEKLLVGREAELAQARADALCLAGDYSASDQLCETFLKAYPKSPLAAAVRFRHAENAYFQAQAAQKAVPAALAKLQDEAIRRYQLLLEKHPDLPEASLARYSLALCFYQKGDWEKVRAALEAIPPPDRSGELALVPYLLADCLLRLMPERADDALAAGQLQEQLQQAIEQLDAFVGAQPKGPQAADTLLRLGHCYQRQAALLAQPPEKAKALTSARVAYKRIYAEWPQSPLLPWAVFEESKAFVGLGSYDRALTNLRRFEAEFRQAPAAPLARVQLAVLLRSQNNPAEAANQLAQARQQYEKALLADPARKHWAARLQLHHGLALREAGKLLEAGAVFDALVKQFPGRPEALEASLRAGQCRKEEGQQAVAKARMRLAAAANNPAEQAAAKNDLEAALRLLQSAAETLQKQAEQLKQKTPDAELRARMLYDAAWAWRALAEADPALGDPKVANPAEARARGLYQTLIAQFADGPLTHDARLELSELLTQRGELDAAVKLLNEALDREPPPELTERIRLRLGACQAAKQQPMLAAAQWEAVARTPNSRWSGLARELLNVLAKDLAKVNLPRLGQPVPDRGPLGDVTSDLALAPIQTPQTVRREAPAPVVRQQAPDPFEFRGAVQLQAALREEVEPVRLPPRLLLP